jgi:erythronate-4-phosphate dehydrogenase
VKEVFSTTGKVITVPGRTIDRAILEGFDVLLVRSVTKVDESLLSGSRIRFIGTATTGMDHLDLAYLHKSGITFAAAEGANANSVVEYIWSLIIHHACEKLSALERFSIGVVGCGKIGSSVADRAERLGMKVLRNDPPLQEARVTGDWHDLEEILGCDIISLHVPLTKDGLFPTFHLFDREKFSRLTPRTYFINASRGAVADNPALLECVKKLSPGKISLDVWEEEPYINTSLLSCANLSTPHVAGYSYDGKVKGTVMLYESLCRWTKMTTDPKITRDLVQPLDTVIEIHNKSKKHEEILLEIVVMAYDIERDDANLRKILKIRDREERGRIFDRLRKEYPARREFTNYRVKLSAPDKTLAEKIKILGFRMDE